MSLRPLGRGDGPPIGLLLTKEEYVQLSILRQQQFDEGLSDAIFRISGGHVGAANDLIEAISRSSEYRAWKHASPKEAQLSYDTLIGLIPRSALLQRTKNRAAFGRGLPSPEHLQENFNISKVFRQVLNRGYIIESELPTEAKAALILCSRNGWLHSDRIIEPDRPNHRTVGYAFPSPLHRWYLEYLLLPDPQTLDPPYDSLYAFVCDVLKRLLRPNLEKLGPAFVKPEPKPPYQHEFHRSCSTVADGSVISLSEFGNPLGADFFIPAKRWGTKILSNEEVTSEIESGRFTNGSYQKWLEESRIEDYIILDFRSSRPNHNHAGLPKLYRVAFSDDYRVGELFDSSLRSKMQFRLLEKASEH